jgi:hypothetical protein
MECIECKSTNPDSNHYCGQCGAALGRTLAETVHKEFRDRQAIEVDITESIVARLMRWSTWLGSVVALFVALFGLMLHGYYHDVGTTVENGKRDIMTAIKEGQNDIDAVRQTIPRLKQQVVAIQADINQYKKVNNEIEKLQTQLTSVKGQIVDLGSRDLKANTVMTTGPGPGYFGIGELGCLSSTKGYKVIYCAQGSPTSLFQLTSTGDLTPVSGRSAAGFQDLSTTAKPTCNTAKRGTFFVEKGAGRVADKPFLCARKSDNTFDWVQLVVIP